MQSRPRSASEVSTTHMVMPHDTNHMGNLMGGRLMHMMDTAAAICAARHSHCVCVTVAVDRVEFRESIRMGQVLVMQATLGWTGRTSMEVDVTVWREDPYLDERTLSNTARFTFVALGANGRPTPVPALLVETQEQAQRFAEAARRRSQSGEGSPGPRSH